MRIHEIKNPISRFVAFIKERESIRMRREMAPWPWTEDPILQHYRFTNIHREDDAVSKHYQRTIRGLYGENSLVFPATVLYRWFNRPSTCDDFFNAPDLNNMTTFNEYITTNDFSVLLKCLNNIPPPHVTGAYIITGKPGYPKGEGVLYYFHQWNQRPWSLMWDLWLKDPPLLETINEWLMTSEGLGSFMRGQIVADLKYLPFLMKVPDWWTWAAPGPGSMRGLNIVLERDMHAHWKPDDWLLELTALNGDISPMLDDIGIGKMHNQDLQNCLCEFSKYTKTMTGAGRPRQIFKHGG
jgi:hypothetical protein